MSIQELKRQQGKIKALLNTLKTGTNAYSVSYTRGKIMSKWEKMGDIFSQMAGGPNGAKAANIMNATRRMMGP